MSGGVPNSAAADRKDCSTAIRVVFIKGLNH